MKSRYVSLRKNPAGSPENTKISYPGKGTRFGKHLFITCLKIEYTLCFSDLNPFNYCPLVIVQVVWSSDNALNNFSHLFNCVLMVI